MALSPAWISFAEDRQSDVAAFRHVNAASRRHHAGAQGEASVVVVISVPAVDPGLLEGTSALEFNVSSIEEVEDVEISQLHAELLAGATGLVVRQRLLDEVDAVLMELASVQLAAWARRMDNVSDLLSDSRSLDGSETSGGGSGNGDLLADKQLAVACTELGRHVSIELFTGIGPLARFALVSAE